MNGFFFFIYNTRTQLFISQLMLLKVKYSDDMKIKMQKIIFSRDTNDNS